MTNPDEMTAPGKPAVGAAIWLRIEGAAALVLFVLVYAMSDSSWLLFFLLLLAPDLSMLGYLAGNHVGAICYNVVHTYALPVGLGIAGAWMQSDRTLAVALIWAAHIALDRMLGYGLKLADGFQHTHLVRIGRGRK